MEALLPTNGASQTAGKQAESHALWFCFSFLLALICAFIAARSALLEPQALLWTRSLVLSVSYLGLTAGSLIMLVCSRGISERFAFCVSVITLCLPAFGPFILSGPALPTTLLLWPSIVCCVIGGLTSKPTSWQHVFRPAIFGALSAAVFFIFALSYTQFTPTLDFTVLSGQVHSDTLFHSAIAQMEFKYSKSSVGLDGLTLLPYYTFSHRLVGGIAGAFGATPFLIYPLLMTVFAPTLFVVAMVAFFGGGSSSKTFRYTDQLLALTIAGFVVFFSQSWRSAYSSESQFLGLVITILLSSFVLRDMQQQSSAERLQMNWFSVVGLCLTIALVNQIKLPIAMMTTSAAIGIAGWVWLGDRRIAYLLACLSFAIVFLLTAIDVSGNTSLPKSSPYAFLEFYQLYPEIAQHNYRLFTLTFICIIGVALGRGHISTQHTYALLFSGAGVLGGSMVSTFAGGHIFLLGAFAPASMFIIAFALAAVLRAKFGTRITEVLLTLAATIALFSSAITIAPHARKLFDAPHQNATMAAFLKTPEDGDKIRGLLNATRLQIQTLPQTAIGKTAVFAPPKTDALWQAHRYCWASPLIIPAVLGLPLVKGLAPNIPNCSDPPLNAWGYSSYKPEHARSEPTSDIALCEHASERGFEHVIILEPDHVRKLKC